MKEKLKILILLFYEEKEAAIHSICKEVKFCIKRNISLSRYKRIKESFQ